jgi:hypothetical protein
VRGRDPDVKPELERLMLYAIVAVVVVTVSLTFLWILFLARLG